MSLVMSMIRIALEVEETLQTLLKEYFDYEFVNTKDYNFPKIYSEHFDLAILDSIHENLESRKGKSDFTKEPALRRLLHA